MKTIYIWGANAVGKMVRDCVDAENNKIVGFIDNDLRLQGKQLDGSRIYSPDEVENNESVCVVIAPIIRWPQIREQLLENGFCEAQMIAFFDQSKRNRFLSDVFISEDICEVTYQNLITEQKKKKDRGEWYGIEKELYELKKHPIAESIVVIGKNEYSEQFICEIKRLPLRFWGRIILDESVKSGTKCLEDLLYEDPKDLKIYIFEPLKSRKVEGRLLEMGITSFCSLLHVPMCGTRMQDVYDVNIGYTWIDNGIPGFVHLKKEQGGRLYKIVTLGGSTTDATFSNIQSWPECLFELCRSLDGVNVEIYNGGMGGYASTQEMRKLIRDVLQLQPDLVLSYSGVNDMNDEYYAPKHPMCLSYEAEYIKKAVEENCICNTCMMMEPIHEYTLGMETDENRAQHWMRCERIMRSVCREFGIGFHGFLQPCVPEDYIIYSTFSAKKVSEMKQAYSQTKELICHLPENDWLHDFTHIFDGCNDVYYDGCHVYEKGNRMIARNMMPYVLRSIREGATVS